MTPWTIARQAPLSMGFSKQEYWSELLFPSPGDLPNPEIKPGSPALQGRFCLLCCYFLQSWAALCNPMDCSPPGSSVHGILQVRILEWVAMPSSRRSSQPRDRTQMSHVSCIGSRFFTTSSIWKAQFSSVHFSRSVVSNSLWPHGLQYARPPCPSPTPGVYSNSCPLSRWCHPTISSSVILFSSHLQSFPASESFPKSQFFASGGQSIGVSPLVSVLPMNIQDWFPLGWTGWISLQSKGFSTVFSQHHRSKASFLQHSAFL